MNTNNLNPAKREQRPVYVIKSTTTNNIPRNNSSANGGNQVKKQNFNHKGEQNFQLVRLLTTNPAAALPAIFSPSGKYEQRRAKMAPSREQRTASVQTQQPHGFVQVPFNAAAHNVIRTAAGQFFVSLPVQTENYPYLYATEDEIKKKGSCCDTLGYFDLESILPIDCQMNTFKDKSNDI